MEKGKLIRLAAVAIAGAAAGVALFRIASAIAAKRPVPEPFPHKRKGKLVRLTAIKTRRQS
ncbi:MAG: hypothetical protein ACYDFU_04530 [Nitrospirota bacterium]